MIDPEALPDELCISAVPLAELSAGVQLVSGDDATARDERGRRMEVLARTEHDFDPIPFGGEAAGLFGRISAAVLDAGRTPCRRTADLMIAATAAAEGVSLYTAKPDDFVGLDDVVEVVAVPRPAT